MKQLGAFLTKFKPIVEELAVRVEDHGAPSISFAVSVLGVLRRALGELAGVTDAVEAGPTVEEERQAQNAAYAFGDANFDESPGLSLGPRLVDDDVEEEVELMRRLEVLTTKCLRAGLKAVGTRWLYTK